MKKYGTRSEVYDGTAECTRGGLRKEDLILSKTNKIVSKKKSEAAAASYKQFGFNKRAPVEVVQEPPKKRRRRKKKKIDE